MLIISSKVYAYLETPLCLTVSRQHRANIFFSNACFSLLSLLTMVLDADYNALRYNGPKILKLFKIMLETPFFCFRSKFDIDSKFYTFKALALIFMAEKNKNILCNPFTQSIINICSYFPNIFGIGPPKGGFWGLLFHTFVVQSTTNSTEWVLSTPYPNKRNYISIVSHY